MKKITEKEQKKIRKEAKKELGILETFYSDASTVDLLNLFKSRFNICETVYKKVLKRYLNMQKKANQSGHLKINVSRVKAVFKFAGYDIEESLLTDLF